MIKAAIFDMDGLLIDSEPFWRKSHITTLAEHGKTITEDDVRLMAGRRTDEVVNHWRATLGLEHVTSEDLEKKVVEAVITSVLQHGKELPGVFHVLELLKKHAIPMAVASSSAQVLIDAVLHTLGLNNYFILSYSAKNEQFGKPHPGVFLTTAKLLGVQPEDCVVFEDAVSGVKAAKAANMLCIAVPEPVNFDKEEYELADLKLKSLEDINWGTIKSLRHSSGSAVD